MNIVTSAFRESGQLFYEKVLKEMTDTFIDLIQHRDAEVVSSWNSYFSYLQENWPYSDSDLDFVDDWTSAECLQFIRAANFPSILEEAQELFLNPKDHELVDSDLHDLAKKSLLGALQVWIIDSGIEPNRIDEYLSWRRSSEFDNDRRYAVFQDCVIHGKHFPCRIPSAAVA